MGLSHVLEERKGHHWREPSNAHPLSSGTTGKVHAMQFACGYDLLSSTERRENATYRFGIEASCAVLTDGGFTIPVPVIHF